MIGVNWSPTVARGYACCGDHLQPESLAEEPRVSQVVPVCKTEQNTRSNRLITAGSTPRRLRLGLCFELTRAHGESF